MARFLTILVCYLFFCTPKALEAQASDPVEEGRRLAERDGNQWQPKESWVTRHLRSHLGSYRQVTGLERPGDFPKGLNLDDMSDRLAAWEGRPIPARWDWREISPNGLTPIRNQASCGSCWAFSVTATLEDLIRIAVPERKPDLAEQTMVSNCLSGQNCSGGYFTAFNYLKSPGLPAEGQDPYQARNTSCKAGLIPIAKVSRWGYVVSGGGEPTTEQLKIAIMEYGPISVAVNGSFGSYGSGVYNSCGSTGINHMVNLVGWVDDAAYSQNGGGYWILRNSWSASWGESGWMRIVYKSTRGTKCNGIGIEAAYAVLDPGYVSKIRKQELSRFDKNFMSK